MATPSATASTRAEKNQDVVFLIDVSSSMQNILGDVKRAIFEFVLQAQPGDSVVLITFGENVELRFRQSISSTHDINLIERELVNIEPTEYFTYITGALDRGLEELRLLERNYPDHLRTLVLMSDGKNNPPDGIAEAVTFDDIMKRYPGLLKKPGTAFFYLSLGSDPDPQVLSFMESVEGSSFDLGEDAIGLREGKQPLTLAQIFVEPISIDLGTILGPKATATVSLAFFPVRGYPSNNLISASIRGRFKNNPSWKTILEIKPEAFNGSSKPWSRSFFLKVDSVHEGTIVGTLELEPAPGQVLFIDPSEIPITMTIRQPHVDVMQDSMLEFGPFEPRKKSRETQIIPLVPNSAAADETIRAGSDIELPDGMTLDTQIEKVGGILELAITVATDESFDSSHSMTVEGSIHLSGTAHAIKFSQDRLEVRIRVAPPSAVSRLIPGLLSRLRRFVVPAIVLAVLALVGVAGYWWLRLRPRSALEGKLVLLHVKGRSLDSSKVRKVSLRSVGKSLGRDTLSIGSAKEAGITLPHKSVAAQHCEIYARLEKGNKRIFIEPIGKRRVIVNLQKIGEATPLSDRDIIEIGAYTFRFENPHPYKQIVVKYMDGRISKGTPATWDIESNGFSLLPRDALPGSSEEIFVAFADLKAVYFVRDFDGQLGKKIVSPASQIHGLHMKLTFHDGEEMEGYTSENYNQSNSRFYFFPADQSGNTISLLVERQHLKNIDVLDPRAQNNADTGKRRHDNLRRGTALP